MQIQIPLDRELRPCGCDCQPRHYLERGKDLHFIECSPCGFRTSKFRTFERAAQAWDADETIAITARAA